MCGLREAKNEALLSAEAKLRQIFVPRCHDKKRGLIRLSFQRVADEVFGYRVAPQFFCCFFFLVKKVKRGRKSLENADNAGNFSEIMEEKSDIITGSRFKRENEGF